MVYGSEIMAAGSMGIALFPGDGDDFDGLFAAADAAMPVYLREQVAWRS